MQTTENKKCIGFIGLGKMGLPMAENLARSPDWTVLVLDQNPAAAEKLAGNPGWGTTLTAASRLADFSGCAAVITMLPDSTITNAVLLGAEGTPGLADILPAGTTVLDMGSSDPGETRRVAELLAARGIALIDTPVSGSVVKALSGELTIMVGAGGAASDFVDAILRWMGTIIIDTGPVGSAHAMKTLNNYVYSAGLLAVSEALLVCREMGLDEAAFAEVLNVSSGRNFTTETKLRQFILPRVYNGGFAFRLMRKDLQTVERLRKAVAVEAPQMALCAALAVEAEPYLSATADATELYRFLEENQKLIAGKES